MSISALCAASFSDTMCENGAKLISPSYCALLFRVGCAAVVVVGAPVLVDVFLQALALFT